MVTPHDIFRVISVIFFLFLFVFEKKNILSKIIFKIILSQQEYKEYFFLRMHEF